MNKGMVDSFLFFNHGLSELPEPILNCRSDVPEIIEPNHNFFVGEINLSGISNVWLHQTTSFLPSSKLGNEALIIL